MLFNSFSFIVFLPIVFVLYWALPHKFRWFLVLVASYYFYMSWNARYVFLILFTTIISYASARLLENERSKKIKIWILAGTTILCLGILFFFKYFNFASESVSYFFSLFAIQMNPITLNLLLPVGISFYTFQALGYVIDVYKGDVSAEHHFGYYATFISFFPQLVAGPIERSGNLLSQIQGIQKLKLWDFERVRDGLLLMFWGLFQKLVIADRASLLVNQVYGDYREYGFFELAIASVLFAFQIYCDFGGYTNIARGAAKVMGFSLMQNFRQPYFAIGIKDFWKRWHISLTSWFTDYLYIPLGGNRKGVARQYVNILIVFAVSGLWHGASWHFVVWGLLHAFYQIFENIVNRLGVGHDYSLSFSQKLERRIGTFVLTDIAWVFFAADNMYHVYGIFQQMFFTFQTANIYALGLDRGNWFILMSGIIILAIVDSIHEQGRSIFSLVSQQTLLFRWVLYLGLIWSVILFGIYGVGYDSSQFIYFQF